MAANLMFELDKLRTSLLNRGLSEGITNQIVNKALSDIKVAFESQGLSAMDLAIESGVKKRSPEFINQLELNRVDMILTTESGNFDFSEPPLPMLPYLLRGAKPMKDGSGVYKVIPVGGEGKPRASISNSIYDNQKALQAERIEGAQRQARRIAPKGSVQFRTATSKQPNDMWVLPTSRKNFTEEVSDINKELTESMDVIIQNIIRSYEEGF